jgi:hypothetical protein
MTLRVEEGQVFAIPLTEHIQAIGVTARVDRVKGSRRKPYIIFAYFFGPYLAAPSHQEIEKLEAKDAVMRDMCSILYLYQGKWAVIGQIPNWRRENWPLPLFYRNDLLQGPVLVRFADDNLVSPIEEMPFKGGDIQLTDEHGTSGSKAIEIMLRQRLNISEPLESP